MSHTHAHTHHISSLFLLWATFFALVGLTVLTVALAQVQLGRFDIFITLGIATVKAALVAIIFMHLQHDRAFNGIVLIGALAFMALFIGMCLMDSAQYQPEQQEFVYDQKQLQAP